MRVELHDQEGVVGEVRLVGGHAVPSNDLARRTMADTKIVLPGPRLAKPEDGEDYLKGLVGSLAGTYFWAELKD